MERCRSCNILNLKESRGKTLGLMTAGEIALMFLFGNAIKPGISGTNIDLSEVILTIIK
jgi:hypothetical protein